MRLTRFAKSKQLSELILLKLRSRVVKVVRFLMAAGTDENRLCSRFRVLSCSNDRYQS